MSTTPHLPPTPGVGQPVPPDPLVDEVRAIRRKIGEQYGDDVRRWMEDLRRQQEHLGDRVVYPPDRGRAGRVA